SNLEAMQTVLLDCFDRARRQKRTPQVSLRQALSCYYSGNFVTGFEHGYTRRVVQAAASPAARPHPTLHPAKESS
ncbi:MAG: lytic transglycosylase domain-containing protein, partial [Caldimonas sp.]